MRSALTMLGIIIGVAAVIAMVAVGSGATAAHPGTDPEHRQQPDHRAAGQRQHATACGWAPAPAATLTEDDAKAIAAECPSVALVAPTVRGGAQVVYGSNNWATTSRA